MLTPLGKTSISFTICSLAILFCLLLARSIHAGEFHPKGELLYRIHWVHDRFDFVTEPAFTDPFILQDVRLDPTYPRRFQEFSGDISGRFLEVLSVEPRNEYHRAWMDRIVSEIMQCQKEDGRFGNTALEFTSEQIGRDHMALLWGNGRLLVGLLRYYEVRKKTEVLESAKKLGDFFKNIFSQCAQPEIIQRLNLQGANGFICFTQWSEGLELLARATGDNTYRDMAKQMEPLLQPPFKQHTHGYLTTLRGDMLVWETTKNMEILTRNEQRFEQLLREGWVHINGGVAEYFDKTYPRDEGCSEADFVRWCLQLWKATNKEQYLEYAERCLLNSLFPNQFETGDFGHHTFDAWGYVPAPGPGRAWWCCTMHGLRALHDVKKCIIDEPTARKTSINLFFSGEYLSDNYALQIQRVGSPNGKLIYHVVWLNAPETEWTLTIRNPQWAEKMDILINDTFEQSDNGPGTINITRMWNKGDKVSIHITPAIRFINTEHHEVSLEQLRTPQKVAMFIGPWLMGISATENPMFHGEPYAENVILLPSHIDELRQRISVEDELRKPLHSGPRLSLPYRHSGFPDICTVTLSPIPERSQANETTFSFWFIAEIGQKT